MGVSMNSSIRFIFIYRGYVHIKSEMRPVRFDSFVRGVDPEQYYQCVDLGNLNVYDVKGSNIFDYHLYNMRILEKSA